MGANFDFNGEIRSRDDACRIVRELVVPHLGRASPGSAQINPGITGASFPNVDAGVEGFARPLWALAPLAAGGGTFDGWETYRRGLSNGTDPDHSEYWGPLRDNSQKLVELAPIGVALALATEHLWEPLPRDARERVKRYMRDLGDLEYPDNNWRWFRVLATVGLESVGADIDWSVEDDLERLESFSRSDGWYADGPGGHCDYYTAWELHVDALVYGELVEGDDERVARFRERAAAFAPEFRRWFAGDGAALPYGRSLTYRFAQGAYWGALAFADLEALPWTEIRGLWQRHLEWWFEQPIFTEAGTLALGYRYPTLKTTEAYNSPSSPYWGMKAFLPLALPKSHPFWRADPAPLPELETERAQASPKMITCRDRGEVTALVAGADVSYAEKYNKFAYSTAFGFGVASGHGLERTGIDGTLALGEDDAHVRTRANVTESRLEDGIAYSQWEPWPDVTVETWLVPSTPWHVRVHALHTERSLQSVEGGFPLSRRGDEEPAKVEERTDTGLTHVRYPAGRSGLRDPTGGRKGSVIEQDPNSNVLYPRTVVPVLRGEHESGTEWFATVAFASTDPADVRWEAPPVVELANEVRVESADGIVLFERDR